LLIFGVSLLMEDEACDLLLVRHKKKIDTHSSHHMPQLPRVILLVLLLFMKIMCKFNDWCVIFIYPPYDKRHRWGLRSTSMRVILQWFPYIICIIQNLKTMVETREFDFSINNHFIMIYNAIQMWYKQSLAIKYSCMQSSCFFYQNNKMRSFKSHK
jgi:hypothetical protein